MLLARKSNCDCAAIRRKRQKTSTNGYTTKRCHSDEKQKFVVPSEASEPAKRVTTARKSEKRGQSWVKGTIDGLDGDKTRDASVEGDDFVRINNGNYVQLDPKGQK
jgi:hypothetical protein